MKIIITLVAATKLEGNFMIKYLTETKSLWQQLAAASKPIYIYGMGDGAIKIIDVIERMNIKLAGIYASDEFVRGHSFYGHEVKTFSQVKRDTPNFISLLAFAAYREPLLAFLYAMQTECEFYAPDVPVVKVDETLFDLDYISAYNDEFTAVYNLLADEQSKAVFINTLNFKVSGKIDYLKSITTPIEEVYRNIIKPTSDEIYIDLGAYNGDTILEFLHYTNGNSQRIVAFEPDAKNFRRLNHRLELEGVLGAECHNLGAWDKQDTLYFKGKGGRNSKLDSSGGIEVAANSVDNILAGKSATTIKLDVEGAEYNAIMGSRFTIERFKPKLMVSAYHKNEDLFALPLLINSIRSDYKIYLRHHPYIPSWETNFYCI